MNIDEKELKEFLGITEEDMAVLGTLSADLWNGPYYIVDSEENSTHSLEYKGETIWLGNYTCDGITGDAFPKLIELAEKIWESLPGKLCYFDDCGGFSGKEPDYWFDVDLFNEDYPNGTGDEDEDEIKAGYWREPEPYYELSTQDILGELVGKQTAREMAHHF